MGAPRLRPLRDDDPVRLGPYRLIARVGAGGMGRVYLGRTVSGRLVALKTLLAEGEVSETDRRRFAREVALARRVNGLFTVTVLDADAESERPWMATEYVPALSLAELVREVGALPPDAVRWIAAGMAEALVDLHGAGIVHRDVKPGNVLLPLSGPRLIDFGISHALDLTRTSLTLGTIAFTSPEQARGEASTPASDVYSTGTTLFHLATARPPYAPDSDAFRLLAHVQRAEVALDGLPRGLDDLIRPLLKRDPSSRPTPRDILAAFERGPVGGSELLPAAWTDLIRASHEYVPPPEAPDRPARTSAGSAAPAAPDPAAPDPAAPDPSAPDPSAPDPVAPDLAAPDPVAPRPAGVVPALHSAPTRTARPKPAPAPDPVPRPVSTTAAGGRGSGRRVRVLVAAALAVAVSTGGYLVHDRMSDGGQAAAVCLANTRVGPGDYKPVNPVEVDCDAPTATMAVVAHTAAGGPCPKNPQPSEHWPGSTLCVGPKVVRGDCLDETRYDSGYLPSSVLWAEGSCAGPSTKLRVSAVHAWDGRGVKESACGAGHSNGSDGLLWTDSTGYVYCLEKW
ncbi:protein kinase domain-containing protein [Streptomyces sp. NPDC055815]